MSRQIEVCLGADEEYSCCEELTCSLLDIDLKEKYAVDMLKLVPENTEKVIEGLEEAKLSFEKRSNHIRVIIPDSMYGLQVLNNLKDNLKSFEVIQGTMDDVFLNITGRNL